MGFSFLGFEFGNKKTEDPQKTQQAPAQCQGSAKSQPKTQAKSQPKSQAKPSAKPPTDKGTVTSASLNVRKSPNGAKLGVLKRGAKVEIINRIGSWMVISYEGQRAYVFGKYIDGGGGGGKSAAPTKGGRGALLQGVYAKHAARLKKTKLANSHKGTLASFKKNWKANKKRYEAVSKKTGVPAKLIAALHWRESTGNFSTYLHQGDPLGKKAVNVPSNIPIFQRWEPAAVHALKMKSSMQKKLGITQDTKDMAALLTYAETYNGLGYHKYHKDVPSPYVYSGTNQYSSGKYVKDGKFSKTAKDKQVGVYAMLKQLEG